MAMFSTVFIVDDDASVREALGSLFRSVSLRVELFGSALEFLQGRVADTPGCIVLDVRLPGLSGLDFQSQLAASGIDLPIIFMTGHGDIPMSVRAMKAGAIDFLAKPFREQDMLDAVACRAQVRCANAAATPRRYRTSSRCSRRSRRASRRCWCM